MVQTLNRLDQTDALVEQILGDRAKLEPSYNRPHAHTSHFVQNTALNLCGVIVFLTHEPRRFWLGEFQLGHLVYWTSHTIKRVVRSTLAAEAYSVSEAVQEAQWLWSVPAEMWPSVPGSLPRS